MNQQNQNLSVADRDDLIRLLEKRFAKNPHRHPGLHWQDIESNLISNPPALHIIHQMEQTGGEPDLVLLDKTDKGITM